MFSIPLAKLYPNTFFYCIEGNPINYKNLLINLKLNGIKNVRTANFIVENSNTDKYEFIHDKINTGGSKVNLIKSDKGVNSITLDTLLHVYNNLRLLKIDIEGSEFNVIHSPSQFKNVDNIIIEIHGNEKRNPDLIKKIVEKGCKKTNISVITRYDTLNGIKVKG